MENLINLSDKQLVQELSDFGFSFVDGSAASQRIEKAPVMVLSTPGGNTPLVKVFTFQFRWENPRAAEPVIQSRRDHLSERDSLWVSMDYNLYKNCFEVAPAKVKMSPKGVPVPAYRAITLFKRKMPVQLYTSHEVIVDQAAYDVLEDYKQKDFDTEIVGAYMLERIRRYLNTHEMGITPDDIHGRNDNDHLRHVLTEDQVMFVCEEVNKFIAGQRGIMESGSNIPKGESNEQPNFSI